MLKRLWRSHDLAPKIVFCIFVCIIALVMIAEYLGFSRGFGYLAGQAYFGPPLSLFVLEVFLLVASALYVLSAVISGFFSYFRSADLRLYLSSPVAPSSIFRLKQRDVRMLSSWAFLVIGLPLILAFGVACAESPSYYLYSGLSLVLLLYFLSYISTIFDFALLYLFERTRPIVFIAGFTLVCAAIGYAVINTIIPQSDILVRIFDAENLSASTATTRYVSELFLFVPSHPLAATMMSSADAVHVSALILISLYTIIAGVLCTVISRFTYAQLLMRSNETALFVNASDKAISRSPRAFPRLFTSKIGALFEKDLIMVRRNFAELSRTSFIFFLLVFYLSFILIAGERIGRFSPDIGSLVLSFHFAAISYFVSILALRLVYPSISLEGRAAWIIWSSPMDLRELVYEKFLLFSAFIYVPTELLFTLTASSFNLSFVFIFGASILLSFLVMSIVSIALFFGTRFADFQETDIDEMANSFGGLLTTASALVVGVMIGFLNYAVTTHLFSISSFMWICSASIASFILVAACLHAARSAIVRLEVR